MINQLRVEPLRTNDPTKGYNCSLQGTPRIGYNHTRDIYRCYVQDRDTLNLRDSSSSQTQRQVNALIMSCPTHPDDLVCRFNIHKKARRVLRLGMHRHETYVYITELFRHKITILFPNKRKKIKGNVQKERKKSETWTKYVLRHKQPGIHGLRLQKVFSRQKAENFHG